MGQVIHFEITADDVARARKFYEVFGWKSEQAPIPGGDYWLVDTGASELGRTGAIMARSYSSQPVINWISVEDIEEIIKKVEMAGGKITGEQHTIPGIGKAIYIEDTEGNQVGLLQPFPRQ
jgi:predicted enzyme related to lactoylglutathione lyase